MAGGGSAPRGEPWLAPTQAAPCPLGPHAALLCRLLRSGGSGGSRAPQSADTLGKQMNLPGTCPPCTMVMWAWSATPHPQALCQALFWFPSFIQTQRREGGTAGRQGRWHPCSPRSGSLVAGPPRLCVSPDGIGQRPSRWLCPHLSHLVGQLF